VRLAVGSDVDGESMGTLTELTDGTVGYFWPDLGGTDNSADALAGHARLGPDGQLLVDVLSPLTEDRPLFTEPGRVPHSLLAATSVGGALFLDVGGVGHQNVFGGSRPNTRHYRCGAVVFVPVHRVRSHNLRSVTAFFPGVGRWAGLSAATETPERKEDGRLKSWSVKLESAGDLTERLPGGKTLSLSTHWEVEGPVDRRILYAPVSLTVASKRPSSWVDLVRPLWAIQGLISLAFDGLVLADGGRAEMDLSGDEEFTSTPTWWSARLMRQPPGARLPSSMNESPSFSLATLGGVAGLRRWIALQNEYGRAVGPLVSPHRFGSINVETRLLELAAAMEYWVRVHRQKAKWATYRSEIDSFAHALALHMGEPFRKWVGDADEWARHFWDSYNSLKHRPNETRDPYQLSLLAESGAVLLQCALLNRAGASRRPAQVICKSHRFYELGRLIRELVNS
jgi:hypothetical protein